MGNPVAGSVYNYMCNKERDFSPETAQAVGAASQSRGWGPGGTRGLPGTSQGQLFRSLRLCFPGTSGIWSRVRFPPPPPFRHFTPYQAVPILGNLPGLIGSYRLPPYHWVRAKRTPSGGTFGGTSVGVRGGTPVSLTDRAIRALKQFLASGVRSEPVSFKASPAAGERRFGQRFRSTARVGALD